MVDWKLYIDSPLTLSLDICRGSLTEGAGGGLCFADDGYGDGYGDGDGNGYGDGVFFGAVIAVGGGGGDGYGLASGSGGSATKW